MNAHRIAPRRKRAISTNRHSTESGIKIPNPSAVAIKQSRTLHAQLSPPRQATNCERPPVAYISIDENGRAIMTVEGPVELEPDPRRARGNEPPEAGAKRTKTRARKKRKRE